jgi:CheY-like chemotaxis protein
LTRQLLTFSRKQVLQPKPVDLSAVVGEAEKLIRRLLGTDISLEVTLGPDAGIVVADPTQIDQVIVNLAVNARDAMPNGGTLAIETRGMTVTGSQSRWPSLAPGRYATLIVRDTGSGMSETVRAKIFDPFYTTKSESSGTGLGLATVYGIVTQAGGSIFVESEIARGTQFTIFLPEQAASAVRTTEPPSARRALPATSAGIRILLVEDDAHVRTATHRMLAAAGYTVADAADGQAALDAYDGADPPIDVIVTDMSMPRMNGRELAQTLRSRGDRVPVLLVSGFLDPRDDIEIDCLTVHQKPIDGDALIAAVEAALRAR